jgi:hypothetical protein
MTRSVDEASGIVTLVGNHEMVLQGSGYVFVQLSGCGPVAFVAVVVVGAAASLGHL